MALESASAWSKPGSWALDAESHESEPASVMDFPTLAAAAATKPPKKKKPQTLSLAEFTTGSNNPKPVTTRLTHDEMLALPTGPREHSAEELARPRGFGYSYNSGGSNRDREESGPRRTGSGPRDNGPSRADEVDDWGKTKKSVVPERRGGAGGGGFFESNPSRADDANSWVSNKRETAPVQSDSRRSGSSNWGFNKERDTSSDTWGKKREEADIRTGTGTGTRPRLVLQRRTLPLASAPPANGSNGDLTPQSENGSGSGKSKGLGSNPFGAARPREEVLAEKGQDWRDLEEKLESAKIREEKTSFGKKTFGAANGTTGVSQDRVEQAWRKPVDSAEAKPVDSAQAKPVEPTDIPSSEDHVDDAATEN